MALSVARLVSEVERTLTQAGEEFQRTSVGSEGLELEASTAGPVYD